METLFISAYFAGMVIEVILRVPYSRQYRRAAKMDRQSAAAERVVHLVLNIGMLLLPLIYALSPWLRFADYPLSAAAKTTLGLPGLVILAASIWIFWHAHRDLGASWSPTLEILAGQQLVTHGIYGRIRHPMYLSLLLWGIAQALLLTNWIAGPASIGVFLLTWFVRVPREERMMLDHFGDEYRTYCERTGRLLPNLRRKKPANLYI